MIHLLIVLAFVAVVHPELVVVVQGSYAPLMEDNVSIRQDVSGRSDVGPIDWADSYSDGGSCYCASSFDHSIDIVIVDTPLGRMTVREVCNLLGEGPRGGEGRPKYNDIQCGNGPANNAGDEDSCPGRTEYGQEGCKYIGPKWNFAPHIITPTKAPRRRRTQAPQKPPTLAPLKPPTRAPRRTRVPIKPPSKAPTLAPLKPPTRAPRRTRVPIKPPAKAPIRPPIKAPTPVVITPPIRPPIKTPVRTPINQPVRVPIQQPIQVPIKQPVRTPIITPIRTPVKVPIRGPVRSPVRVPIKAPVPVKVPMKQRSKMRYQ